MSETDDTKSPMAQRFRGFLPIVIDVETGGFNAATDALLELSAVPLKMEGDQLVRGETIEFHIDPFEGANIEQSALEFTGIDLENRSAVPEQHAIEEVLKAIRKEVKAQGCNRAVLVGHNAHFDLGFINAAVVRCEIKRNPFHPFSCFDTASLSGLAFGHTVLARACALAGLEFSNKEAHTAAYDAEKTADLYCLIVNKWQSLGGWPLPVEESVEEDTTDEKENTGE
ncbi:MAG: ribonuclease T [Agarilytica sp.]